MPANLFRRGETYYARFHVNGELQRVSLRTGDIRLARKRLKAIREGAESQAFGIRDAVIWEQATLAYAEGVLDAGSLKPATAKRYRVSLRQVHDALAGKGLHEIYTRAIAGFVSLRQADGATNATIKRDLTTISRVMAFARSQGLIETNPVDAYDRKMIRERQAVINAPADSIITAAAAAIEAEDKALAKAIHFLRANGVRTGEAIRARWEHVHGDDLTIHETKNGRVRTIRVDVSMLECKLAGLLVPGLPDNAASLAGRWRWVNRDLPPEQRFRLHDLRHAYAIAEVRAGRDIYDLSHHLGHSSVKVTERYLGYVPAGRRAAIRNSQHAGDTKPVTGND